MGIILTLPNTFLDHFVRILPMRKKTIAEIPITKMDFFALPEAFIARVMRRIEIRDRLTLRLTCREFESLVSEAHAGYFDGGKIARNKRDKTKLFIAFGDSHSAARFTGFEFTEEGVEQCLYFLQKLFSTTSISGTFEIEFDEKVLTLDAVRKITKSFEFERIEFSVNSDSQLESSLLLMDDFPNTKYILVLRYIPSPEKISTLPSMEELHIRGEKTIDDEHNKFEIDSDLFFTLLGKHDNLCLDNVQISADNCDKALQIFLNESSVHSVEISLKRSAIVSWLRNHKITEDNESGDVCGEFTIAHISVSCMHLRLEYTHHISKKTCHIHIRATSSLWSDENARAVLCMEKEYEDV
ncbi:hypothetical protein PMAYCL1PPCAC_21215 [Pristionchus mayeri]|uniref:F-box domain-containing protein n=1 Tax=Pristionchus mayeri TaxID=1317129 RepID=A0AAN5CV06_9BILA|nr:hypothetical protein PMAYCL1PPCAC_21215 [Pristionchus mayeri]